jgi:hypothetical protein
VPYVPETEDDALMEHQYDGVYWEPAFYDRRLRFAENQAAWLREHYRPDMVLLEVGPGLGLGAKRFLELVPGVPYYVVEPHPAFRSHLEQLLGSNVRFFDGPPESALDAAIAEAKANGRTVLLYLDNVLEHVPNPYELIARMRSRLPRGSRALFDVPNERGLRWRTKLYESIGATPTTSPSHVNLFTSRAFHVMLRKLGLRHSVKQRGIRKPEEVNCIPGGAKLTLALSFLRILPIDRMLGVANNLRVRVDFIGLPSVQAE